MSDFFGPQRDVGYSELLSLSLRNLGLIWRQVLAYLAVVGLLGLGAPLFGNESTGLAGFLLYFVGQYWLFRSLLKARGLLETERIHFLAFVGLAALLILPIIFGLAALLLPGIFLIARWIAAPAYIVARGEKVFASTGTSAAAVRGNTVRVIAAMVVLFLIAIAVSTLLEGIERGLGGASVPDAFDLIEGHLLPLALLGLSTATYQLLGPKDKSIEEVFG